MRNSTTEQSTINVQHHFVKKKKVCSGLLPIKQKVTLNQTCFETGIAILFIEHSTKQTSMQNGFSRPNFCIKINFILAKLNFKLTRVKKSFRNWNSS